jgi:hypothetical protein
MSNAHLALQVMAQQLASAGQAVSIGLLDTKAALQLWPWRVQPLASARNAPPLRSPDGSLHPAPPPDELHCLLISQGDEASFAALQAARQWLAEHPVLDVAGSRVQVLPSTLPTAELAQLFIAAGRPMTLSAAYVIQG